MSNRRAILKTKSIRSRAYEAAINSLNVVSDPIPADHTPVRWTCCHHMDGSDITAYVMASKGLEVIAETRQADGIDARANAALIVRAVNNYDRYKPVIDDLVTALELCLKSKDGLTWAVEQEANVALKRARDVASPL